MRKILKSNIVLLVLATGLMVASCSVEKNTSLSRFYHNLSSNYNIYFNGKEAYITGLERIKNSYRDDYSSILPVFEYSDENAARSGVGDMDRAIQKASKLISLHSMTAKPEMDDNKPMSESEKEFYERREYNNWVDDSYLLMGKAQLIKHEYDDARITLLHNIRETHDSEIAAESKIWLARTYTEMGNYQEANRLLTEITPGSLHDRSTAGYYLSLTDLYIRQNQYDRAVEPLSHAVDNINSKKDKIRPLFILARLYEETGNSSQATKYYREIIKLNPPYEMEFNARISQAGVFDVESGDIDEIRKELDKLLRDDKNKEYRDQIYFAHGNLSMREGKTDEAIGYYHKSAAENSANNNQKGRSYLMLAEYYFEKPDYRLSQMYYDSAVTFLDQDYPDYLEYKSRSLNLNELISCLDVVSRQDSLQHIASLSPSERDNIINGIIRKIEEEERQANTNQGERYNMGQFYENQRRFRDNIDASGKWYFYNQSALTFGRTEFRSRWGSRELEDNWRRLNKSAVSSIINPGEGEQQQNGGNTDPLTDVKSKEYYLRDLPLTDSLLKESDRKTAEALFNAARVYHEKFNDVEKANQTYTTYMHRFPDHFDVPNALYNLYKANMSPDPQLADSYRDRLLTRYPDSEYAKMLSDPGYLRRKQQETNRAEIRYNEAYQAWESDSTRLTIDICNKAIMEFPESELAPKFMLLKAYAMAPFTDEKSLKEKFVSIRDKYPGTAEAKRAVEMIAYLNEKVPDLKKEEEIEMATRLYDTVDSSPYRFIMILKDKDQDMNRLTFDVINYNIDNFTNENYNTRGELVNDSYIKITVTAFDDREKAMDYYRKFKPEDILRSKTEKEIITFIISSRNYDSLIKDGDNDRYYLFFRENYFETKD